MNTQILEEIRKLSQKIDHIICNIESCEVEIKDINRSTDKMLLFEVTVPYEAVDGKRYPYYHYELSIEEVKALWSDKLAKLIVEKESLINKLMEMNERLKKL